MQEIIIQFEGNHPVEILGPNNSNLTVLRKHFTALKIIARGDQVRVLGSETELEQFERKWNDLIEFHNRYQRLTELDVRNVLQSAVHGIEAEPGLILIGVSGKPVKARTPNQVRMVKECETNDMVIAIGPAGTGKTYTAVALAVKALRDKEVQRIVLTRPAVEAGESLGFLPGDLKEKLDPYLRPLYDALLDMIPHDKLAKLMERSVIEIAPLAFMRGRTLANAFVILDEAQNATENQMKMFLTRMGKSSKFIVTGDTTQIDLPKHVQSGLAQAVKLLDDVEGISIITLDRRDVVRHQLVERIIAKYESTASPR